MRHVLTTAALCAALLSTAACTGLEQPSPPPTPEAALTTDEATSTPDEVDTTTAAPSNDETSATSGADGPPELPAEATEQTAAGAEAAFEHFIDTFNYSVQKPESGLLPSLAVPSCAVCIGWEEKAAALEVDGDQYASDILSIDSFEVSLADDMASGTATFSEMYPDVVASDGSILLESSETQNFQRRITLIFLNESWVVEEVLALE